MSQPKSPKNITDTGGVVPVLRQDVIKFKVIVAIDFGTHGTGLGYAIVGDDEKNQETYIEQDWCKNVDNKNKTDILLTYDGKFMAFGEKALELYINQGDDSDSDSSSNGDDDDDEDSDKKKAEKQRTKPMLFESFKMSLYEKKEDGSDGDIRVRIPCVDGRLFNTSIVFISALKYMKEHIFKTFEEKGVNIDGINDIQWIVTVPAIWSDRAKYKMEVWALKAALINRNILDHLRIVYEPDCASISCQYESKDDDTSFGNGERYVLIDAGGGTVDIAWHQVKAEYCMEEIHHPTGGPWGSDYIDHHFDILLIQIFGKESITPFKQFYAANYTKIKDNFRKSKMTFYNNNKNGFHGVQMTAEFMDEIPKYSINKFGIASSINDMDTISELNKIVNASRPFGLERGNLVMDRDILLISHKIWREYLFDRVMNPMIKHVQHLIPKVNQIVDKNGKSKNIKYCIIAGGLASSKYFQFRINQAFGMNSLHKLSIRIPRRPILSVIDGALKLGLYPNYIKTRRLKYTYGIAVDRSQKNVDINKLPKGYLDSNSYIHPNTHKRTVRNLFSKWIQKNTPIDLGAAITKGYRRFHKNEKTSKISIYCSAQDNPYIVKGDPLASVTIRFPNQYQGLQFTVQFYFGDTKIKASVQFKDSKSDNTAHTLSEDLELEYETF